jgi:membrane protein implicated in regulation of membrane protease activity
MKIEFIYLRYVVAVILTVILWFVISPEAFNINPVLGFIVIAAAPLFDYWLIKPIYNQKSKKSEESEESEKSE